MNGLLAGKTARATFSMKAKKLGWKRCWRGKVPHAPYVLIYDSNENVSLVDTRGENFAFHWMQKHHCRIRFYIVVPRLPHASGWLWPQESAGRVQDSGLVDHVALSAPEHHQLSLGPRYHIDIPLAAGELAAVLDPVN